MPAMAALSVQPGCLLVARDLKPSSNGPGRTERLPLSRDAVCIIRDGRAFSPPLHTGRHHRISLQARRHRAVTFAIPNGPDRESDSEISSLTKETSEAPSHLDASGSAREDVHSSSDNLKPDSPRPQNLLQSFQSTVKSVGRGSKWVSPESLEAVPELIRSASVSIAKIQDFDLQHAREQVLAEVRSLPSTLQEVKYRQVADETAAVVLQAYHDWWTVSAPSIKWPAVIL